VAAVVADFPEVIFIKNEKNLGFAGGNNVGILAALRAGADYVYLLNNDTVVDPAFLDELVAVARSHQRAGALCGTILELRNGGEGKTHTVSYAGGRLSRVRGEMTHLGVGRELGDCEDAESVRETGCITGCGVLLPSRVLTGAGLLDEDFFFGTEDIELSWRLLELGWRLVYVPKSLIWHRGGRSRAYSPSEVRLAYASKITLMRKRLSPPIFGTWLLLFTAYMTLAGTPRAVLRLRGSGYTKGSRIAYASAIIGALLSGWRTVANGVRRAEANARAKGV
jgi:GT2 family glycosyltransferase